MILLLLAEFQNFEAPLRKTPRFLLLENCMVTKIQCKLYIFIFINNVCAWLSHNCVPNISASEIFRNARNTVNVIYEGKWDMLICVFG